MKPVSNDCRMSIDINDVYGLFFFFIQFRIIGGYWCFFSKTKLTILFNNIIYCKIYQLSVFYVTLW